MTESNKQDITIPPITTPPITTPPITTTPITTLPIINLPMDAKFTSRVKTDFNQEESEEAERLFENAIKSDTSQYNPALDSKRYNFKIKYDKETGKSKLELYANGIKIDEHPF